MKRIIVLVLIVVLVLSVALATSAHRKPPCPWRNKHCYPTATVIMPTATAYTPTPAVIRPDYTQSAPVVCLGGHCPVKTKAAR